MFLVAFYAAIFFCQAILSGCATSPARSRSYILYGVPLGISVEEFRTNHSDFRAVSIADGTIAFQRKTDAPEKPPETISVIFGASRKTSLIWGLSTVARLKTASETKDQIGQLINNYGMPTMVDGGAVAMMKGEQVTVNATFVWKAPGQTMLIQLLDPDGKTSTVAMGIADGENKSLLMSQVLNASYVVKNLEPPSAALKDLFVKKRHYAPEPRTYARGYAQSSFQSYDAPPVPPTPLFVIPGRSYQDGHLQRMLKAQEWDTYRNDFAAYRQAQEQQAAQQAADDEQLQMQQLDDERRWREDDEDRRQEQLQHSYNQELLQQSYEQ